jgi:hypothetical protein
MLTPQKNMNACLYVFVVHVLTLCSILTFSYPFRIIQILYEDGETIHNVLDEHVVTEQEYFDISKMPPPTSMDNDGSDSLSDGSFPDAGERVSFTLTELFQLRCKSCRTCLKKDCDRCFSCQYNKLSTSRDRQVCYFSVRYRFYRRICNNSSHTLQLTKLRCVSYTVDVRTDSQW